MIDSVKQPNTFYASIFLYALFLFFTQWSLSAAKMDALWLNDILTSLVNLIVLPSILALTIYGIIINFKYYAKHVWFTLIFISLILCVGIATKSISFTLPLLLGFAGFYSNNRITAKITVLSFGTLLLLSCAFSLFGLNGGDAISKPLFGVDDANAKAVTALGLSNPNSVMLIYFNVIALMLFLCKNRRQAFFTSVVAVALVMVLSVATGSSTGLIIGLATVLLVLYAKYNYTALRLFRKITPWMFLLVTLITFMIAVNFGLSENRQNDINSTLTGRPYFWNLRIENHSYVNVFGSNDKYSGEPGYALDNAPLYTLVYFGIVIYLIFLYIFYAGSKYIQEPELLAYILAATLLLFSEKPELYGLILIFLQKSITERHLLYNKKNLL